MKKKISKLQYILTIIGVVLVTAGVSYAYFNHQYLINTASSSTGAKDSAKLTKVDNLYAQIMNNYVGDVKSDDLINGALKGMTDAIGDPYSTYLPEKQAQDLTDSLASSIEGIGATLTIIDDQPQIAQAPIKGTPAQKAGLKAGDLIIKVDGKTVAGQTLDEIVSKVRGKKGTEVTLTLSRDGKEFEAKMKRDTVKLASVTGTMEKDKIGRITISTFAEKTASEFEEQIKALREKGATQFIIDVRQNPGGLLDQVEVMGSMLLKNGQTIVKFEDKAGNQSKDVASKEIDQGFKVTEPVVILVDGGSASASEILSGAVQDNKRGKIIGTTTFGKGTVQNVNDLGDNSELKLTIGKWLTPNGTWINKKGIQPDIEAKYPDFAYVTPLSSDVTLKLGDNSDDVKTLKTMLDGLGYKLGEDSNFEATTEAAVKDFQTKNQLEATGIVEQKTNAAMQAQLLQQLQDSDPVVDVALKTLSGQ